jgi:AcrR family transcriptional regulator
MSMRNYRQQRRKETAAETRRRLVEATVALHNEQGIVATSMKQIARRAGVSIGAAYHHFPTYDAAVSACGAHNFAVHPLPHPSIFRGVAGVEARLGLLARELFAIYRAIPGLASAYAERHRIAALDAAVASLDRSIETLLRAALAPQLLDEAARPAALALLHDSFYRRLAAAGLGLEAAADEAAALLATRLALIRTSRKGAA